MTVYYEWDVETVSVEDDDVLEHDHVSSFKEAMNRLKEYEEIIVDRSVYHRIVLVRDSDSGRSWAQFNITKFELDEFFDDTYREVSKVPLKFHKEVLKENCCPK